MRHDARSRVWLVRAAMAIALAVAPALVYAQVSDPEPRDVNQGGAAATAGQPRVEVSVLAGVLTGASLGESRATMLTNDVPTSAPTALFVTDTTIGTAPIGEVRAALRLSRAWSIEGGVSYAHPSFDVDISGDVEAPADVTATSNLTQLIVDAAVQYRWQGRRVSPFVMGGGGYLRQLDEPRTTADTGAVFYGGGGIRVALAPASRGFARRLSLRGDVRVVWLRDGVVLDGQRGPAVLASGGIAIGL